MAILVFTGATSADSTVLTNWVIEGTSTNPTSIATGDTFKFNSLSTQACTVNQATVGCIYIDSTMTHQVTFAQTTFNTDAMFFGDGAKIHFGAVNNVVFSGNHSSQAGMPYQDHNVVFAGSVVWGSNRQDTVFQLDPGSSTTYISNGQFPRVKLIGSGAFSLNPASSVTGTHTSAEMITLEITANITFTNTYLTLGTAKKVIEITSANYTAGKQFICLATTLDMKNAVLHLYADNNQFVPTSHDTTNFGGASFTCELGDVILDATSQEKIYLANGKTLVCNSLEIKNTVVLLGGEHPNAASMIKVASRPKLRGTWNFKGLGEGFYQSVGAEPELGGGGGGGSGTVTSIATTAPITGGTITSTGTIGISAATTSAAGSMSSTDKTKLDGITAGISNGQYLTANANVADNDFLRIDGTSVEGLTAAEVRTAINVEDGADVTDTANVTAAGALMDSEVTNLAQVKAFNSANFATAADGVLANSALQPTQAEGDRFTATSSAPFWGGSGPPATIQEAIDRVAAYAAQEIAALGGAPVIP